MTAKPTMKPRPSPSEAVRIASKAAPHFPPAQIDNGDRSRSFTTRLRSSTLAAIEGRAKADGATLKQVICRALAEAGIAVAPADLEDGTPRRRAA